MGNIDPCGAERLERERSHLVHSQLTEHGQNLDCRGGGVPGAVRDPYPYVCTATTSINRCMPGEWSRRCVYRECGHVAALTRASLLNLNGRIPTRMLLRSRASLICQKN